MPVVMLFLLQRRVTVLKGSWCSGSSITRAVWASLNGSFEGQRVGKWRVPLNCPLLSRIKH